MRDGQAVVGRSARAPRWPGRGPPQPGRSGPDPGPCRRCPRRAQVDGGNLQAEFVSKNRRKVNDDARSLGEGLGPKNLGADVAVQAPEVQVGRVLDRSHGLVGLAGGQGQAELLVLVGGRDVLVAARVDAGLQAHQ